jgi:membrane protein
MQENNNQTLWQIIKRYFNVLPDKDGEKYVIKQITNGINFQGSNLWILIFAVFIASLGLNVNSTAVIIGAMLISPLMGPIIGMGLALGIADLDLFKQSIKNYLVSTFISVVTATIYFTLSPITNAQSELLARTSPTLYDVLIALFGGAAGFLAMSTKGRNNWYRVLPLPQP